MEFIKEGQRQYKANLHAHSTLSDGALTPEELKKIYKEAGYSILAITDHEFPRDHSDLSEKDFLLITGYEAYIRKNILGIFHPFEAEIHINLFAREAHNEAIVNYNPQYCKYLPLKDHFTLKKVGSKKLRRYSVKYINSFIQTAKKNGYICALNHPYWSMEDFERIQQYEGFFSMELVNTSSFLSNNVEYNAQLYDFLLRKGKKLFIHSADDNHNKHPLKSKKNDSFGGYTMVIAEDLSYEKVFSALEKGNFYSSTGPTIEGLSIKDGVAKIKTTPAQKIVMYFGSKKPEFLLGDESAPVCKGEFLIPKEAKYIRFSVFDFTGKSADTRAFFKEEWK